jgi:hypothetical protein
VYCHARDVPADASWKTVAGLNGTRHFLPRGVLSVFSLLGRPEDKNEPLLLLFLKTGSQNTINFFDKNE